MSIRHFLTLGSVNKTLFDAKHCGAGDVVERLAAPELLADRVVLEVPVLRRGGRGRLRSLAPEPE